MARPSADKSIPPPLRALGGWEDAEWFDPSVMDQGEVVGISLPALPGSRKQNFELDERRARQPAPKTRPARQPAPARAQSGIGQILDDVGALRWASFRRPRFFFEAAPTLFFADIPAASLKLRAAETLRRNLIANALRGCVLSITPGAVIAMFWPRHEAEITAFIRAASPPATLHAQFDLAEEAGGAAAPAGRRAAAPAQAAPPRPQARAERERLLAELDGLRAKIIELERQQSAAGALETLGLDDARLKAMLLLLHPDKHNNSAASNEAAKWVNELRDILKANKRP